MEEPKQEAMAEAARVPDALRKALDENVSLRAALQESGMPKDFQAMVLGLATLRQLNSSKRRR